MGRDTAIAINQPLQLNVTDVSNTGFVSYSWSPSTGLNNPFIKNPVAITDRDITYIVTVRTAEGCQGGDDIKVKVFVMQTCMYQQPLLRMVTGWMILPKWYRLGSGAEVLYHLQPLGRSSIYHYRCFEGWDGRKGGMEQSSAVFVWTAQGSGLQKETWLLKKEHLRSLDNRYKVCGSNSNYPGRAKPGLLFAIHPPFITIHESSAFTPNISNTSLTHQIIITIKHYCMNRYNIFYQVHKGLRELLYNTASRLQQTDFTNAEETRWF